MLGQLLAIALIVLFAWGFLVLVPDNVHASGFKGFLFIQCIIAVLVVIFNLISRGRRG